MNHRSIVAVFDKPHVAIGDKILGIVLFLSLGLFQPDIFLLGVFVLLIPYLYVTSRAYTLKYLGVAVAFSVLWMLFANELYGYNRTSLTLFGLNLFTLLAWSLGLFATYLVFLHYKPLLSKHQFWIYTFCYALTLVIVETVAYHLLGIHNLASAQYPGLPLCDCIHAPTWMQIAYFLFGPVYYGLCVWVGKRYP